MSRLNSKIRNELIASIPSSEILPNIHTNYDESNKAMNLSKFPYHIEGIVD